MERTAKNADEYSYLVNFEAQAAKAQMMLDASNDTFRAAREIEQILHRCWIEFTCLHTLENHYRPASLVAAN